MLAISAYGFYALLAAAAVIDARERRLPHGLALALVALGAACALAEGGAGALLSRAASSCAVCGALVAFEIAWRRVKGAPGQGMGDIRALFALMLVYPEAALAAYALALIALALSCAAVRSRSLPLIPFLAPFFILLTGLLSGA